MNERMKNDSTRASGVTQVVEHLPKCKALHSNPVPQRKNIKLINDSVNNNNGNSGWGGCHIRLPDTS
jgi:hypothetical protein